MPLRRIVPWSKQFAKDAKSFLLFIPNCVRKERFVQICIGIMTVLFVFMIIYFSVMTSSRIIRNCEGIFGFIVFTGVLHMVITISYFLFICYEYWKKSLAKYLEVSTLK